MAILTSCGYIYSLLLNLPWQSGMTQSLNVAACATLVLGEALRLRGLAAAEEVSIQAKAVVLGLG